MVFQDKVAHLIKRKNANMSAGVLNKNASPQLSPIFNTIHSLLGRSHGRLGLMIVVVQVPRNDLEGRQVWESLVIHPCSKKT